jgi:hypothetical protein
LALQFFHNYLLWGIGLFLLPILIHLLRRRRIRTVRLPTYEFLMRTQRRIARRSQLKNWILLALRISAVSLVVFLAARPLLSGQGWAGGNSWSPLHLTIIIDNSASMSYRSEAGSRFDLAKREAAAQLSSLASYDRARVLATVGDRDVKPSGAMDKEAALARLDAIRQTDAAGEAARTLKDAIEGSVGRLDRRRIVVFSDMAKADWQDLQIRGIRRLSPHTLLQFVRVAPEAGTGDFVIRDVRFRPWPPRAGSTFAVVFKVLNRGGQARANLPVSLYVDERKANSTELSLGEMEEKEVSFRVLAPEEGALRGRIELASDSLPATDRYFFSAQMGSRNRVLIIDGDPRRGLVDSESFYVSNALRASAPGGDSPILAEVVASYEMGRLNWDSYDLVIACNVGAWPAGVAESVRRYVEKGGGFLLAGGHLAAGVSPGSGWLPAVLGAARGVKPSQSAVAPDSGHPIFSLMGGNPSRLLSKTRLRRVIPLSPTGGGKTLLSLKDGTPILVVGQAGAGKAAVWGSTCDRAWTDIPVRPVFVPFLRGIVNYLGSSSRGEASGLEAGNAIELRVPATRSGEEIQVRSPSGGNARLRHSTGQGVATSRVPPGSVAGNESGDSLVVYADTYEAGIYEIVKPGGNELVAANVPAAEAQLDPMSDEELRKRLPGLDVVVKEMQATDERSGRSVGGRLDLGIYLFALMAVILVSEGALADRS